MEYQTLRVEIRNGVGIIWMNRPKLHNAIDEIMIAELSGAMSLVNDDPAVRAVVLAGVGKSFCAGTDLNWVRDMSGSDFEKNRTAAMNFATMMETINTLKKPTIARVQGPAFDGGVGMIAACDMAVAAYEAEFCLSEVRVGLIPAVIGPYVVRAMGERMASRYILSAERFGAAEAYRVGLVTDIAPMVELDARINELLGQLIQGGPSAQALSKEWIRTAAGTPVTPELIDNGARRIAALYSSEEVREGISSLVKKRRPAWVGQIGGSAAKRKSGSTVKRRK